MPKIKINDFTPNDQPRGFETYDINVMFSEEERTILVDSNETKLTFTGDAYAYLLKSLKDDGYNGVHPIEISMRVAEDDYSTVFYGNIFNADCEFDYFKAECEVSIMDSGYNSYIKNNRQLVVNWKEGKTKNGFDIDADSIVNDYEVSYFTTPTGLVTGLRSSNRVEDVLAYLVSYMSDNKLKFRSDYLSGLRDGYLTESGGSDLGFMITTGLNWRSTLYDFNGEISFKDLYEDLAGFLNLLLTVETIDGVPTVRVEHVNYFRDGEISVEVKDVREIRQSFIQDYLYGTVRVGGAEAIVTDGAKGGFEQFPPFDFKKTIYTMSGNANLDNTKDISGNTLITDTSSIYASLFEADQSYDNKFFLIAYQPSLSTFKTPAADIFDNGDFFYNGELTNQAIFFRIIYL